MLQREWRNETFFDVINLALGGFLFVSPWIFGFTAELARHTSWMEGATIAIVSLFAIIDFFESEEWINLAIGLWVAVCGLDSWVRRRHDRDARAPYRRAGRGGACSRRALAGPCLRRYFSPSRGPPLPNTIYAYNGRTASTVA